MKWKVFPANLLHFSALWLWQPKHFSFTHIARKTHSHFYDFLSEHTWRHFLRMERVKSIIHENWLIMMMTITVLILDTLFHLTFREPKDISDWNWGGGSVTDLYSVKKELSWTWSERFWRGIGKPAASQWTRTLINSIFICWHINAGSNPLSQNSTTHQWHTYTNSCSGKSQKKNQLRESLK